MEKIKIRKPVVAGQFYPASGDDLKKQIESFLEPGVAKKDVLGCILPHAGYIYSGKIAAQTLSVVKIKNKIILLGPNHSGQGANFAIMTEGAWQTPLGNIEIDTALAEGILNKCAYLEKDILAHSYEHSLEVELPFLQCLKNNFTIVPITILSDDLKILCRVGQDIGQAIASSGIKDEVMLLASSDMTHYEPEAEARRKDKEAIGAILELNEKKLIEKIRRLSISMCGWAAVAVLLSAAKQLGARYAELIAYRTSGDVTGDTDSVVGYAGMTIS